MCTADSERTAATPPGTPARSVDTNTSNGTTRSTDQVASFERIAIAADAATISSTSASQRSAVRRRAVVVRRHSWASPNPHTAR